MHAPQLSLRILFLLITLVVPSAGMLHAQRIDNRGTEFMLAFMPTNGFDEFPMLAIGISASRPTTGTLTYMKDGTKRAISIPVADSIVWIDLDIAKTQALMSDYDRVGSATISVSFRDPVSIIGSNTQRWSGDAFLALPTTALGREYIVLAYPNTVKPEAESVDNDFPSHFGVVATENGTTVSITPSTILDHQTGKSSEPFTVTLNRGEIYMAHAYQLNIGAGRDVSGTRIIANHPVAVYGGVMRGNIPWNIATGRDHLVEQMIPVANWQNDAIVTPFYQIGKTVRDANIVRVVATRNGTLSSTDGSILRVLREREVTEVPLDYATHLTADVPILVAQYHHSAVDDRLVRLPNDSVGDPTMALALSPAQFDTSFVFQSLATVNYTRHFINVVVRNGAEGELRLDGGATGAEFVPFGTSEYSYAQIEVSPGSHVIRASTPFGLLAYGYGVLTAYGYPCGLVLVRPTATITGEAGSQHITGIAPNPATGGTTMLAVTLAKPGALHVEILDMMGSRVAASIDRVWLTAGDHSFEIDISGLPPGSYLVKTTAAGAVSSRRLVVVR